MKRTIIAVAGGVALLLGAAACSSSHDAAQSTGQSITERAFTKQQAAEPYPLAEINDSTERANLIRKLIRFNDPNKIGYVYLFNFGKVVGYYVIKGKVSNTDSQLTTSTLEFGCGSNQSGSCYTVPGPGDDGSYGPNENGVFFFTTANIMVESNLDYTYADEPLPINVPLLGGDKNAQETPAQLAAAQQSECRAVGKAAGINLPAGQECTAAEIAKLAPQGK